MKLSERLKTTQGDDVSAARLGPRPAPVAEPDLDRLQMHLASGLRPIDPFADLKGRVQAALYERLGNRINDPNLDETELRRLVVAEITAALEAEPTPLTSEERELMVRSIRDDVIGYGPIEAFLADPTVTEIMVNSDRAIYVERDGMLSLTSARYGDQDHLRRVIDRIVGAIGRRIDESSPTCDARLPDGSRVNAVIPPLAVDGPQLTIRKFAKRAFRADDLVTMGTLTSEVADFLDSCVSGKLNVLISGGTGTGKTTLLNVLSGFIPAHERVVTIEDAVELQMAQPHVIRLESRPPNIEGRGEVTIRELVRNSLRMRPDRIVVGEVRGGEALDMLQAMNTGHEGSLSTLHANSPRDALSRLETMVLMAGYDLPMRAIREQIASALDLMVQISRLRDGSRRVTKIVEITGMEADTIAMADIFEFDFGAGMRPDGSFLGTLRPTGLRPTFTDKLAQQGMEFPASLFDTGAVPKLNRSSR